MEVDNSSVPRWPRKGSSSVSCIYITLAEISNFGLVGAQILVSEFYWDISVIDGVVESSSWSDSVM